MKKILITALNCSLLAACALRPHVPPVQQGNVITPEQVTALKCHITKAKAKAILGSSMLNHPFDTNYWTYIYNSYIEGHKVAEQKLTLQFKNNSLIAINDKPCQ